MVRRVRFLRVHFWFGHDQYWMGPDVAKKYLKGLFTYYVSQKQEFVDPPSPLGQQWSSFG